MNEAKKTGTQYKYIVLNSDSTDATEARINDAADKGFTVAFVVPGYQRGPSTWSYAALIMSKDNEAKNP